MADEKAEIIIQKIRKLQLLVKKYSNEELAPKKNRQSQGKSGHSHKKDDSLKKHQSNKFSEVNIPDDLIELGTSLLSRGKKIRHIHNAHLIRHYLDLWISSLICKLLTKQNDLKNFQGIKTDKAELNTDELINDPVVKEAEKVVKDLGL